MAYVQRMNYALPAFHTITVSVTSDRADVVQAEDTSIKAVVTAGAPATFGPYGLPRNFRVVTYDADASNGISVVIAEADVIAEGA